MTRGTDWGPRLARRTTRRDGALGDILAMANVEGLLNFSGGFPAPEVFPTEVLADITRRLITDDAAVALQYAPSAGLAGTREALADHLELLEGVRPTADGLMITSGGIDAVTLLATSMLDPGDVVVVEEPSYVGAVAGFAGFEAALRGVDLDDEGLDVEAHGRLLADGLRPKLLYTIPDFQNPSGRTLSVPRRLALVDLCRRHDILIVEDVAYRELAFDEATRPPSLWSIAPDTVVQIGTFAKTVFPGIRLGWAAGPPEVVAQLVVAKQNSDQCAGALGQRMVEEFLRGGHFPGQVARERALYRGRGLALQQALHDFMPSGVTWTEPSGGFFVWLRVPGVDTVELGELARAAGVAFVPGSPFFAERPEHDYLRLSFSRVDPAAIGEGMRRLGTVIETVRADRTRGGDPKPDATAGRR
jgi:2-aminoadipate transaminase